MSGNPAGFFKTSLLLGQDELVKKWVGSALRVDNFGLATAIGILKNNELICGVVYNNYYTDVNNNPLSIEMSIASVDFSWCTRYNLRTFFAYPFIQLNLKRVQATCPANNLTTRHFVERLGFKLDGIAREACIYGGDSAVYSLLKHECKWIIDGQKIIP